VGRRFDPDRAHERARMQSRWECELKKERKSDLRVEDINLKVFITHFVPPDPTIWKLLRDFIRPRLTKEYLKSWARILKYGTRGNMPWKKDIMTKIRRDASTNRLFHLHNTLVNLAKIPTNSLEVFIHTNSQADAKILQTNFKFIELKIFVHEEYQDMNSLNNSPWQIDVSTNPWLLTWEHKSSLSTAVLKAQKNSIYICMEDDAIFTQDNLNYFLSFREKLKTVGLIPSFLRTEWSYSNNEFVSIDHFSKFKLSIRDLPHKKIDNRIFVELPNSYSGIIVLDQELAEEYLESPASKEYESRNLTWWDIGARAAMGLQFVNVPKGFKSRNVVLIDRKLKGIDISAWIAHQPNIYAQKLEFLSGVTPSSLFH
jgi:hypothetical protein